jgi:hypothetical protein
MNREFNEKELNYGELRGLIKLVYKYPDNKKYIKMLENANTSKITDMSELFKENYNFNVDISAGLLRPTPFVISKILV